MTEKKPGRIRRVPSLEEGGKKQDQILRGASGAPKMDVNEPIRRPQNTGAALVKKEPTNKETINKEPLVKRQNRKPASPQIQKSAMAKKPFSPNKPTPTKQPITEKPQITPKQQKSKKPAIVAKNPITRNPAPAMRAGASPEGEQVKNPVAEKINNPPKRTMNPQKRPGRKAPGRSKNNKPAIKAYFLGGLNEIGKNFTLFECMNDMIIVDCGLAFPDEDMLGIDIVIPDFEFVEKNADKIRGIFITHGHEDHIGGLPYLLKRLNRPVYGTALTMGLINGKLKEHNLTNSARLNVTPAGSHVKMGCMDIELIHVNHSISDAVSLAIHSPAGVVVFTGDFKIDCTPTEGGMIDLARFAELGKQGVLALMADSTNAEREGYTKTEQMVNNSLETLFMQAENKRLIIATFASNISRVQQIINCAEKYDRKVALSGRSMLNVMGIASELGYLKVPEGILIDLNSINRYANGDVVLITTGSQGEPMSALTRMAFADHRQVEVGPDDFIILSARPIPGNEKTVGAIVDELLKRGCSVVYESMYEVHVSGHACQEELKIMQGLVKPKYFIPVHGEQKHLRKHAMLSIAMGMEEKNIFIGNIGNVLELHENYMKQLDDVPAGALMVDGLGVGDVGNVVLRDRKHLAQDGLIIAVCTINPTTGEVVSGPDIVSRGFVYVRESEALMDEAKKLVFKSIRDCQQNGVRDWNGLKQKIRDDLSKLLYRKTKRNPMILPIIMNVRL